MERMRAIRPSAQGRPGTVSEQVLETLKIARHVAVDERDPDAGID